MSSRTPTPVLSTAAFALLLGFGLWIGFTMLRAYVLAMLMGGILALVGRPLQSQLGRLGARGLGPQSTWGSLVITLGLYLVIVVPTTLFLLKCLTDGFALVEQWKDQAPTLFTQVVDRVEQLPYLREALGEQFRVRDQALEFGRRLASELSQSLLSVLGNLPNLFLQSFLSLATCFFILKDGKVMSSWVKSRIPLDREVQETVFSTFRGTAISTIWATVAAAAAQAIIMLIAYLVLDVPGAVVATGATFILAWVPLIGSTPVWIAGALYLWSQDQIPQIFGMAAFGIGAGLVDNIVRPLVLKGGSDMHPFVSLMAILGGVRLFGILGVFLGPICVGVILALLDLWPLFQQRLELAFQGEKQQSNH